MAISLLFMLLDLIDYYDYFNEEGAEKNIDRGYLEC